MALIKTNPVFFPGEEAEAKKAGAKITIPEEKKEKRLKVSKATIKANKIYTNNLNDLHKITTIVCREWRIDECSVFLKGRKTEVNTARQLIMYFAHFYSGCTFGFIGKFLGNRDRTTVMHGARAIEDLIDNDFNFNLHVKQLEKKIYIEKAEAEKILNYNWEIYNELKNQL